MKGIENLLKARLPPKVEYQKIPLSVQWEMAGVPLNKQARRTQRKLMRTKQAGVVLPPVAAAPPLTAAGEALASSAASTGERQTLALQHGPISTGVEEEEETQPPQVAAADRSGPHSGYPQSESGSWLYTASLLKTKNDEAAEPADTNVQQ